MPHSRSSENRLEQLYRAHAPDGMRIAQLLCDEEPAKKTNAAFVKTVATIRDLRSPLTFEAALRRAVIKECRPSTATRLRSSRRPSHGDDQSETDLGRAFQQQSHRRRAALVLRYFESMNDDQVADVLGVSTGTARVLINRALASLQGSSQPGGDPARIAGELQRLFRARAEGGSATLEPDERVVGRAVLGRRISAVAVVALAVAVVVGSFLAVRGFTQPEGNAPPPPATDEPAPPEVRSLADEQLRPNARLDVETQDRIVASGAVQGSTWHLLAQRGPSDQICLVLRVGLEFERSHCESRAMSVFHGFVDVAEAHDATFITGYALEEVKRLTLEVDEGKAIGVDLVDGPDSLPRDLRRRFFVVVLREELVPLTSAEEGVDRGLRVIRTVLQGEISKGESIQHQPIYLGRE